MEASQSLERRDQARRSLRFANDKTTTIVFPVPVDMINPITEGLDGLRRP